MRSELYELMKHNKFKRGISYLDTVASFMSKYDMNTLTEDALIKGYQRWRKRLSPR